MNPRRLEKPEYSITKDDWEAAQKEWQPNCGPNALAVMTGLRLMEVCPLIPNFKERHYTNATMMTAALRRLGVPFHERDDSDCDGHTLTRYGLCRLQWEGPWTAPGVNPKWAYRHTHWIGAAEFDLSLLARPIGKWPSQLVLFVFDFNFGWHTAETWEREHLPGLIQDCCDKRATGGWWATHRLELFTE